MIILELSEFDFLCHLILAFVDIVIYTFKQTITVTFDS